MSVLAIHPFDNTSPNAHTNLASIGAQHSYFFYQQLNSNTNSINLKKTKQIIPSIPRKHFKATKNSSLSPIRSQKIMPKEVTITKNNITIIPKRPYPLVTTFSSPASLQTTAKKRQRKVSFDEKVIVVCTIFDEDADPDQQPSGIRRHSTGEMQPKSILVIPPPSPPSSSTTLSLTLTLPPITQKITRSLKQFKNRLLLV
ncbi:hypothetical protein INT46_003837 [Mucor plumbeus]|uniref:Uncharacterized protein n=1 Tax=Mucor plumbeus TaxID=97098 RepID=A0A8H7UZR0_9FUNG|nr:hypothetical protein INT46_003837 [Mucor plumbeus]